jgi:hypothetical protein
MVMVMVMPTETRNTAKVIRNTVMVIRNMGMAMAMGMVMPMERVAKVQKLLGLVL